MCWIIDSSLNSICALIAFLFSSIYSVLIMSLALAYISFTEFSEFYTHLTCIKTLSSVTPKDSIDSCLCRFKK